MVEREKAIEFIRRMLALAESNPNENEAQLAMTKASEWMDKFNIRMVEIEEFEVVGDDYVTEQVWEGKGKEWDQNFVAGIIEEFFFVRGIEQNGAYRRVRDPSTHSGWRRVPGKVTLVFFGDRQNVEVARYVYIFLRRTFRSLWKQRRKQYSLTHADSRAYYLGLSIGFSDKMRKKREQLKRNNVRSEGALIVVGKKLDEALIKYHPDLKKSERCAPIRGDDSIHILGMQDGKNINLRDGLRNQANQRKLNK